MELGLSKLVCLFLATDPDRRGRQHRFAMAEPVSHIAACLIEQGAEALRPDRKPHG